MFLRLPPPACLSTAVDGRMVSGRDVCGGLFLEPLLTFIPRTR